MTPNTFPELVRQEMDRTGLDERTASGIVSARLSGALDPATLHITNAMSAALTAPPTANEPPEIPPSSPRCPDCNGAGRYLERVPYTHPRFGKLLPCQCKLAEQAAFRRRRQNEILGRLDDELGSDLRHCSFANFNPQLGTSAKQQHSLATALQAAIDYANGERGWLYLWGPCGVGKSHLAAAVAHAAAKRGANVAYASVPHLLRYIKAGFDDGTSDERLSALQTVDLLILDDLGAEYHSREGDFNDQVLFELINERYLYDGRTVLTSNLQLDRIEPRIASRIKGRSRVVFVLGEDQRGK